MEQEIQVQEENINVGYFPTGTLNIDENGTYDVREYANAEVSTPVPTGTLNITDNGTYDVSSYASAEVLTPGIVPTGTISIAANGTYDVTQYASALVSTPVPTGTYNIAQNGKYDISQYQYVQVSTMVPEGTYNITDNGEYNVKWYEKVNVSTPGIIPTGTLNITTNGTQDVTQYASASVNVQPNLETKSITITENTTTTVTPTTGKDGMSSVSITTNVPGITPTGTLNIVENNTYDVTNYATANVNVPTGGGSYDWSAIGYESEPQMISDAYNYAKQIYDNWDSTATTMSQKFNNDNKIIIMPKVDTSGISNFSYAFNNSGIVELPILDLSRCNSMGMNHMFTGCNALSNNSLNNILKMCINATSRIGSSYRNLTFIGLSSAQLTICQGLSNYENFVAAGWGLY